MNEKEIKEIAEKAVKAVMAELKLDEKGFPKKTTAWRPRTREEYYTMYSHGEIYRLFWENDQIDLDRWAIGNVFKTQEEAQRKLDKMKLEAEIERWIEENDPESLELSWKKGGEKYFVYYDCTCTEFDKSLVFDEQSLNEYYFTSENKVQAFIDHFGDRLKLLLHGKVD